MTPYELYQQYLKTYLSQPQDTGIMSIQPISPINPTNIPDSDIARFQPTTTTRNVFGVPVTQIARSYVTNPVNILGTVAQMKFGPLAGFLTTRGAIEAQRKGFLPQSIFGSRPTGIATLGGPDSIAGTRADPSTLASEDPSAMGGPSDSVAGTAADPSTMASEDPSAMGGSGSSSGSSKIVCTMMNESYGFGSFRNKIWIKYAKDNLKPEHQKGYHKLFLPLVKYAKSGKLGSKTLKKVLEHIAIHRTIDIRKEFKGETHLLGRVYRKILEPICYLTGKYYGKR